MKAFVNYAHRGASQYAPENTLSAFYLGLAMGANGIETDVQKTKDGVLVLFHDNSLTRVTGAGGRDLRLHLLAAARIFRLHEGRPPAGQNHHAGRIFRPFCCARDHLCHRAQAARRCKRDDRSVKPL